MEYYLVQQYYCIYYRFLKTLYKKILADRATIIEKSYNLILNKENKLNNSIKISLSKPKERGGLEQ